MIEKLREVFSEQVVFKGLKDSNFFISMGLPSFLRDWLLKRFADEEGHLDTDEMRDFIHQYLPKKEEWVSIKDRLINESERVKILTKISVDISIKTSEITFHLPNFGVTGKDTSIDPGTWARCRDQLVNGQEVWGIVELGYFKDPEKKSAGKIVLASFKDFCPYEVDLEFYKDARGEFTISEWVDILLGAIDYNAAGYKDEGQKLAMLSRLLPFVEKRLNLIELAPKGTGKTYLFGQVSKYGLLTDGGRVTRAKMFYDHNLRKIGFIAGHDYVAIDEVKLVQFDDTNEMRSVLQGYMERGQFNIGGNEGKSDAGMVFLGNISQDKMDEYESMFSELPALFQESALVDRIHGFIKGWEIPRMNDDLKLSGWALNSEYFCSILHELRSDMSYRIIVDQLLEVPEKADTRDTEAIKRIATAFLKLLFPNVREVEEVNRNEFDTYCLRPAKKMRGIIKQQLGILDPEFKGANIPEIKVGRPEHAD